MNDYEEDYKILRRDYEKVDTNDPESIRKWFDKYYYLNTSELARVAGKSRWHIRSLRQKAGIKISSRTTPIKRRVYSPKLKYIDVPDDWRHNKEWLESACKKHSITDIAKAVGRNRRVVYRFIEKYNISSEPWQEQRKKRFFNKAWLYRHYVDMELTQNQCARLAGVTTETLGCWLVHFGISTRRHCHNAAYPPWVYKLINKLERTPVVRAIYHRRDHIHVRFLHFIWESYYINRVGHNLDFSHNIFQEDSRLEDVPPVTYEYESNLDGTNDFPHHLYVDNKRLQRASFLERRIAMHTFGNHIFNNKYQQLTHPESVLQDALKKVKSADYKRLIREDAFTRYRYGRNLEKGPNLKIIEHFFDLQSVWQKIFLSPRYITLALNSVCKSCKPISTHNMLLHAISKCPHMQHKALPRMPSPAAYMAIFDKLDIRGPVLDVHTGYGEKATACALLGLPYYYVQNEHFDNALDRGFDKFLGLECHPHNGEKVSLLIYDQGFRGLPDLDKITHLARHASNMLVFVPRIHRDSMLQELPPRITLPIKPQMSQDKADYLFLY